MTPEAIYTPSNCKAAYQLLWSLGVFWHAAQPNDDWLDQLRDEVKKDDLKLLRHEFTEPCVSQFLVSTRPHTAPVQIAQRVKGRLQYLLRGRENKPFRRNYSLRSVGSTARPKVEHYIESQIDHHQFADPRFADFLRQFQIINTQVDLREASRTSHALYWYNLHIVLVHASRAAEVRDSTLRAIHDMTLHACQKKGHWLSRGGILPDHVHLTLRCDLSESPESVVLSYMNNLAYACEMKRVFQQGYFVSTFGEYDVNVVPRAEAEEPFAPPSKLGGGEERGDENAV